MVGEKKQDPNTAAWHEAQISAPIKMAGILRDLRARNWAPGDPLEKEWYDELSNLCAPLNLQAFTDSSQSKLRQSLELDNTEEFHEDPELMPVIRPDTSAGDYSMRILSNDSILTHSPATAGLVQVWSIPTCTESYQLKLYSRRAACEISPDGKFMATKTEADLISLDMLPEGKTKKTWRHPGGDDGNSFRIEKFIGNTELVVSDRTNTIHFLSITSDKIRSYPRILVMNKPLLACSGDGRLIVTPDYGKRLNTVWRIDPSVEPRTKAGSMALQGVEKLISFESDKLPEMRASFSPNADFLVLSTPIEVQIRRYPYDEIYFQMDLGRDIDQPIVTFSHDNNTLAVLRRSHPAELNFICMKKAAKVRSIQLADLFSRHLISEIAFSPDDTELLLAGKEKIYVVNTSTKTNCIDKNLLNLVNTRIRDIELGDLENLEKTYKSNWMSLYLRPWAEMLFYLVKRRSYDIVISEVSENNDEFDTSSVDIAIAD